jgi:hypothetical protein
MSHTFSHVGPQLTNDFPLQLAGLARTGLTYTTPLRAGFPRAAVASTRPIDAPLLGNSAARPGHATWLLLPPWEQISDVPSRIEVGKFPVVPQIAPSQPCHGGTYPSSGSSRGCPLPKMTQIYTPPVLSPPGIQSFPNQRRAAQEASYTTSEPQKPQESYAHRSHPYFQRDSDGSDWTLSEPQPMMSDTPRGFTAVHSAKPDDMYQAQPALSQNAPREQLPPLSSLFDTSPHQSRPAQSPYSDRRSPIFPSGSPHDGRHPATPIHPDRSYDSSYYQRTSHSHPYPYMSKPERNGRPGPQGPSLPSPAARRPESPRYEQRYAHVEAPRPPPPSSVNGWSPQSQIRPEYFSRDTSSSFRTHAEQPRQQHPPLQRNDVEQQSTYGDSHGSGNYPQMPGNPVNGEQGSKDTLGPKIWSGTQFFPRFVRQAEVPGEGLCYFYDDGTHCKTVIDGEAVNAHWGVTKAGKPRKRLAIACITCREKKIKCDPDFPRCVQCEKFGRICKFKNA